MRRVWPGSGLGSTILLPLTKKTRVEDVEAEAAAGSSMVTVSCEELSHWRWILDGTSQAAGAQTNKESKQDVES